MDPANLFIISIILAGLALVISIVTFFMKKGGNKSTGGGSAPPLPDGVTMAQVKDAINAGLQGVVRYDKELLVQVSTTASSNGEYLGVLPKTFPQPEDMAIFRAGGEEPKGGWWMKLMPKCNSDNDCIDGLVCLNNANPDLPKVCGLPCDQTNCRNCSKTNCIKSCAWDDKNKQCNVK